jgi:hypothetical protein
MDMAEVHEVILMRVSGFGYFEKMKAQAQPELGAWLGLLAVS